MYMCTYVYMNAVYHNAVYDEADGLAPPPADLEADKAGGADKAEDDGADKPDPEEKKMWADLSKCGFTFKTHGGAGPHEASCPSQSYPFTYSYLPTYLLACALACVFLY